jgi:hypothetical protein
MKILTADASILFYLQQLQAPALVICFACLVALWMAYQKQVRYQQEQDKDNLKILAELSNVLDKVNETSKESTARLSTEIRQQAELIREHIRNQMERIVNR